MSFRGDRQAGRSRPGSDDAVRYHLVADPLNDLNAHIGVAFDQAFGAASARREASSARTTLERARSEGIGPAYIKAGRRVFHAEMQLEAAGRIVSSTAEARAQQVVGRADAKSRCHLARRDVPDILSRGQIQSAVRKMEAGRRCQL